MREAVLRLVTRGDWACALGEGDALASVCRELHEVVEPGLAPKLAALTVPARVDDTTRRRWVELASRLRRRPVAPRGESTDGRYA